MKKLLISACLAGMNCRFDGGNNKIPELAALLRQYHLIPVCPEVYGGMSTPRLPCEITENKIKNSEGEDVTGFFLAGAKEVLRLALVFDCRMALLKERSPSCGCHNVYDGSFSHRLVAGQGVLARLLVENAIDVYSEYEADNLLL